MNTINDSDIIIVLFNKETYLISNEPIKCGDFVYDILSGDIYKCLFTHKNGTIGVEFLNGWMSIMEREYFKKAVKDYS